MGDRYWRIKWRDYNEDDLLISENQAKVINDNRMDPNRVDMFKLNGAVYRYDSIDVVEPTDKRIEDTTKLLHASETAKLEHGVLTADDGSAIANWYKKTVSSKEYEKYYGSHPSYYSLGRDTSGGMIVAFRRVEIMNETRPSHLELCSWDEVAHLETRH